jgi:hypothetical protein
LATEGNPLFVALLNAFAAEVVVHASVKEVDAVENEKKDSEPLP